MWWYEKEQAMSKKTQFFGLDWSEFCILGEIFAKILLQPLLKSTIFRAKSVDFDWIFVKISQNIANFSQHGGGGGGDYKGHPPLSNIGGYTSPSSPPHDLHLWIRILKLYPIICWGNWKMTDDGLALAMSCHGAALAFKINK